jgi:diguanylate cyclase (GGDEF)-like protein/PAS domain S-box-containing protein
MNTPPARRKQEKYLALMLENSPDLVILLDEKGRFLYCSQTFLKQAGIGDFGEINGRSFEEIPAFRRDKDFLTQSRERFKRIKQGNRAFTDNARIDFSGGGNFHSYSINSAPMLDEAGEFEGAMVIYHDITNLLRAEADDRTRVMFDATPLACTFWDREGVLVDCNQEALNLFEVSSKEEFFKRFYEFSPDFQEDGLSSRWRIREDFREACRKGRQEFPWIHLSATGKRIPAEVTLVRVKWRDEYRVVGYTRDLRDIREIEEKRREADLRNRELEMRTQAAQVASEAKSKFLASMSHEIRTPMNAIIGMSDLMRTDNLDPLQQSFFADIKTMSRALLQIINDILDISKIEAGRMEIRPVHFNLHSLCDNIYSLSSFTAESKDLSFHYSFDRNMPQVVYGDDLRIRQVITNIVNNAIKYTQEGYVEFFVTRERADGGDYMIFRVKDTGIGIRREDFPKLFGTFQQLDGVSNRGIVGTGLGLSITRNLVAMMGGEISFESEYGKGSLFTVRLPLTAGDPGKVEHKSLGSRVQAGADTAVLVVDDNRINLKVALAFLAVHNIHGDTAESGAEALEKVQNRAYDLIFMDHMMPGMDGIETVRRIRAWEETQKKDQEGETFRKSFRQAFREIPRKVPIIALSANAVSGVRELFLKAGMNDFISKPVDPAELNRKLAFWLPEKKFSLVSVPAKKKKGTPKTAGESPVPLCRNEGLNNIGGDENLYNQLLDSFRRDHGGDFQKIRDALGTGDISLAHRLAHTLKSAAGLLGASRIRHAAFEIEKALAEERTDRAALVLPLLEKETETLLRELPPRQDPSPRSGPSGTIATERDGAYAILIIDDEESNLMVLKGILSPDYRVFTARNGREGLKRALADPPDLILLDIVMPGMDGFEVLRNLKESEETRHIPVIVITGLDDEDDEERGFSLGAVDYIGRPFKNTIVRARVRTQIRILNQIRLIERMGLVDGLTDIPNRRCFDDRLALEWRRALREDRPLAFLMMDLDEFKTYNDTYGHPQGDLLLRTVAKILSAAAKRPADLAARLGGEEFGILLPETGAKSAREVAERIRVAVEAARVPAAGGNLTQITVSIGVVSLVPTKKMTPEAFIAAADKNLYAAKESGRNRIHGP